MTKKETNEIKLINEEIRKFREIVSDKIAEKIL